MTPILIFLIAITHSSSQPSPFGFNLQFIGKNRYVSVEEESTRVFCNSIPCLSDADSLFTRSSQYKASDPCIDFANFTLGTAISVGPVNDRNSQRGFMKDVEEKLVEKFRRALSEKVQESDEKIIQEVKVFFKMSIKSDHALRHIEGHRGFVEFLSLLGGSPYLSRHLAWNPFMFDKSKDFGISQVRNSSALDMNLWDEEKFNLKTLAHHEPESFLRFFFDLEVKRCKIKDSRREILCLDTYEYITGFKYMAEVYKLSFENSEQILRMLEVMNDNFVAGFYGKIELREKVFKPALKNFEIFLKSRREILEDSESEPELIKIKDLRVKMPALNVDWLRIFNFQLLKNHQVTENDWIQVRNLRIFKKLARNLVEMPKG